jgi:WD40 repeat protein
VLLWDRSGRATTFGVPGAFYPAVLEFHPQGKVVACAALLGDNDHTRLGLWDLSGSPVGEAVVLEGFVSILGFLPGGREVLLDRISTLDVWELPSSSGGWVQVSERQQRRANYQASALGGRTLAVVVGANEVELWEAGTWQTRALYRPDLPVWGLAFDSAGSTLAVATGPREDPTSWFDLEVWDVQAVRPLARWRAQTGWCNQHLLALSADGSVVATAEAKTRRTVWLHDARTGEELGRLDSGPHGLTALRFSPDGSLLVTGDAQGALQLWPWRELLLGG